MVLSAFEQEGSGCKEFFQREVSETPAGKQSSHFILKTSDLTVSALSLVLFSL